MEEQLGFVDPHRPCIVCGCQWVHGTAVLPNRQPIPDEYHDTLSFYREHDSDFELDDKGLEVLALEAWSITACTRCKALCVRVYKWLDQEKPFEISAGMKVRITNARLFLGPTSMERDAIFKIFTQKVLKEAAVQAKYLVLSTGGNSQDWESEDSEADFDFSSKQKASRILSIRLGDSGFLHTPSVETIQCWINQCISTHKFCKDGVIKHVPKRVLEIGANGSIMCPRLLRTGGHLEGNYTALSYCWGENKDFLKTYCNTEQEMMKGISMESMPQTYQDAIYITHALGLHYLWIDALCILQDCDDDWEEECENMANIYRGSYITIVSMANKSCHDGFLHCRDELAQGREKRETEINLSQNNRLGFCAMFYLVEQNFLHNTPSSELKQKLRRSSAWNKRGWTFQESQLSQRTLSFTQNGMFFECREGRIQEDGSYENQLEINRAVFRIREEGCQYGYIDGYSPWYEIIGASYSKRKFTYQSDRLPAIAGFAKAWKSMLEKSQKNSRYLAGLWEGDLCTGLLWKSSSAASRPLEYAAPSWSWASTIGKCHWPWNSDNHLQPRPCYKLVDAKVQGPLGDDSCSTITSGSITLFGLVRKMRLNPQNSSHKRSYLEFLTGKESRTDDAKPPEDVVKQSLVEVSPDIPLEFVNPKNLWCLLIARRETDETSSQMNYAGLLLESADGNADHFRRFGYFELFWKHGEINRYMTEREIVIT